MNPDSAVTLNIRPKAILLLSKSLTKHPPAVFTTVCLPAI